MKRVVQYKMHADKIPYFIQDGGYFQNEHKFIGITFDDEQCFVPSAEVLLTFFSKDEFLDYVANVSYKNLDGSERSEIEKREIASIWWDAHV